MENSELISIINLYIFLFIYLFAQLDFKAHNKGNLLPYNGSINGSLEVGLNSFPPVGLYTSSIFPGSGFETLSIRVMPWFPELFTSLLNPGRNPFISEKYVNA